MTIGNDGNLYFADMGSHTVTKYSPDGELLMTLGNRDQPSDTGGEIEKFLVVKAAGAVQPSDWNCRERVGGDIRLGRLHERSRAQVRCGRHVPAGVGSSGQERSFALPQSAWDRHRLERSGDRVRPGEPPDSGVRPRRELSSTYGRRTFACRPRSASGRTTPSS